MSTKSRSPKKTTDKARLSVAPVGSLVRQRHGGALRNGGTNRGGPGRPPEAIRAKSRDEFVRIIEEIHSRDLSTATLGELALVANTVARYGLGTADAVDVTSAERPHLGVILMPAELPDRSE
jgi:hypothetical protein